MSPDIQSLASATRQHLIDLRRHFHQNPELSFDEHATSARVAAELRELAFEVETDIGGHGVVGHLSGSRPGRCVALRADMDALPIQEESDLEFRSQRPGVMHACGHDVHMACLLGAARILAEAKADLAGVFRFIFQPAEERAPGGAKLMIADAVLEPRKNYPKPDIILGQHVRPDLHVGSVGFRRGAFMASTDEIHLEIIGEGGHAADPHLLTSDAVYVAAQIIVGLQSVISRHCPPDVPSVLTIGAVEAAGATNIIPERAFLRGTFRSMDPQWRTRGRQLIVRAVENIARAHGATADCRFVEGYPMLYNHEAVTRWASEEAAAFIGAERVREMDLWFASEDFAYYAERVPACFYVLGVGNESKGITSGLHTSTFKVDEDALEVGAGLLAHLASRFASTGIPDLAER